MGKKNIHVTIDDEVWFQLRCRDLNISGEVNEFLKSRVLVKPNTDKEKLLKRLIEIEEEEKNTQYEKQAITNKLFNLKKKEDKKQDSEVNATLDAIRASGILAKGV